MDAGRELDALVAEKVMGCDPVKGMYYCTDPNHPNKCGEGIAHYSTDISAAWEVVEKLQNDGIAFGMWWDAHELDKRFRVESYPGCGENTWAYRGHNKHKPFEIECDTAPHAICLAALKTVEHNDE